MNTVGKGILAAVLLAVITMMSMPAFANEVVEAKYADDSMQQNFLDDEIWDDSGNLVTEGGKSSNPSEDEDTFEGWNRFWFEFNDGMIVYLVDPLSRGYKAVLPERMRIWVKNFFHNLFFPIRFVNNILQGNVDGAGVEFSRFIGNTFFGFGGLGNPMGDNAPIRNVGDTDTDTGLTLGHWGMGSGPYVVWPVLGSSSVRDTAGMVGDYFLSPLTYLNPWYYSLGSKTFYRLQLFSFHMEEYDDVKAASLDPYLTFKDAYLSYRENKIKAGFGEDVGEMTVPPGQ